MIPISQDHVKQYQEVYLREHGIPIDAQRARVELTALVCLVAAVHRHMEQHNWPDLSEYRHQ
jgi:hypothetical protein